MRSPISLHSVGTSEPNQSDASQPCTRSTIRFQSIVRQTFFGGFSTCGDDDNVCAHRHFSRAHPKAARTGRRLSEDAIVKEQNLEHLDCAQKKRMDKSETKRIGRDG